MPNHDISLLFIELGSAIVGLAILARVASNFWFSAIPLYLIAGLAFGNGGIAPLHLTKSFIGIGAEIGVLLLLFMLGLEYTGEDLRRNLKAGLPAGAVDLLLNFPPGLIAGLLLGWTPLAAVLLGGVTYISWSGIIAKVLAELGRLENPETPSILSVLGVGGSRDGRLSPGGRGGAVRDRPVGRGGRGRRTKLFYCRRLAPFYWWRELPNTFESRPRSEHFWSALPFPGPFMSNRIGSSDLCETCLPRRFSSSSDSRSIRRHFQLRCRSHWLWSP